MNMENNKELISKLKFIGKIRKGEKINVKHMYIQPIGIITSIHRTIIDQDNRDNTLKFLQDTIFKSFELFVKYENSENESENLMCYNISQDLESSINGLKNLRETYISDVKFLCDIDTLLQVIRSKLESIVPKYIRNKKE
tara:strand:+ start:2053 stop:2472 length:420 start_codon:yes stop_codon:yes gene_type:complete